MADSMSNFIECSVDIQNLIMSVMEFCLVLEFILILLRMTGSAFKKKNYSNRAFWGYFFGNGFIAMCTEIRCKSAGAIAFF